MTLTCHCGAVRITAPTPVYLHACNCSLCGKTGARWGYPAPSDVVVEGRTMTYRRTDKADPSADMHFCGTCGITTHFTLSESAVARFGDVMMGVNARLADERDLAGVELRYPDGRGWSGEGAFGYVREPPIL